MTLITYTKLCAWEAVELLHKFALITERFFFILLHKCLLQIFFSISCILQKMKIVDHVLILVCVIEKIKNIGLFEFLKYYVLTVVLKVKQS